MRERRIRYLPDFVCNAGATIGYTSDADGPSDSSGTWRKRSGGDVPASADPRGPFEGACAMAESFIETWRGADGLPDGPPLA